MNNTERETMPTWEQTREKMFAQREFSELEAFIYHNEPSGEDEAKEFRERLSAVLAEAARAAQPVAGVSPWPGFTSVPKPARAAALQPAAGAETETRKDGKTVRKDRWEVGIRRIVALLWGNRQEFEIDEVVSAVTKLMPAPFNDGDDEVLLRSVCSPETPAPAADWLPDFSSINSGTLPFEKLAPHSDDGLPELPEPTYVSLDVTHAYTADQMRAYGDARAAHAFELGRQQAVPWGFRVVKLRQAGYRTPRGAIYGGDATSNVTPLFEVLEESAAPQATADERRPLSFSVLNELANNNHFARGDRNLQNFARDVEERHGVNGGQRHSAWVDGSALGSVLDERRPLSPQEIIELRRAIFSDDDPAMLHDDMALIRAVEAHHKIGIKEQP